jgi:peptidoglycan/LPS O-acetylase OafA/YrhL
MKSSVQVAPTPRFLELDLLRLVAAFAVMAFHFTFSGPAHGYVASSFPEVSGVSRYGYLGVNLFFLISGLVVLMTAWDRDILGFLVSRAARLYPAFWVAVTLTATVVSVSGSAHFSVTPGQYLANLTMLHPVLFIDSVDAVYWTLWSEVRFYLFVVILIAIGMTRRRVLAALWAWIGLTLLLESGLLPPGVTAVADLALQTHYSHYFIAGMALFLLSRSGPSPSLLVLLGVCFANALYRGALFSWELAARFAEPMSAAVAMAVITGCFGVLALVATHRTAKVGRPWFTAAGTVTYPLYLLHFTIGLILIDRFTVVLGRWWSVALVSGVMVAAAALLHAGVEKPVGRWLRRVLGRSGRDPDPGCEKEQAHAGQ